MRKLHQKAFVVVAMLGSVGLLGAGTAQAVDTPDPHKCTSTATGGDGGAGGSATVSENEITQVNIIVAGDQAYTTNTQTNAASITAEGGDGGQGGDATATCKVPAEPNM